MRKIKGGKMDKLLKKPEWVYKSGFSTPLAFYRWAYFNRDKKVLVIDDLEGLLSSDKGLGLLKCCLEGVNGKRKVYYDTTSEKIGDVPSEFIAKFMVVILANRIPHNRKVDIDAVLSRAINYTVDLSHEQIMSISQNIILNNDDLNEIQKGIAIKILLKKITPANIDFNLRDINKLGILVKYNSHKAEELYEKIMDKDELCEIYMEVSNLEISQMDKIKKFLEIADQRGIQTSQRTYYRIKERMV